MDNELEREMGWDKLQEANILIGKTLGFTPEIEYCVGTDNSYCYSPKNFGDYFPTPYSQKVECERWLKENKEKYPDRFNSKEVYEVQKIEWYPFFHNNWNVLMEAIVRLNKMQIEIFIVPIISQTWRRVYQEVQCLSKPVNPK